MSVTRPGFKASQNSSWTVNGAYVARCHSDRVGGATSGHNPGAPKSLRLSQYAGRVTPRRESGEFGVRTPRLEEQPHFEARDD